MFNLYYKHNLLLKHISIFLAVTILIVSIPSANVSFSFASSENISIESVSTDSNAENNNVSLSDVTHTVTFVSGDDNALLISKDAILATDSNSLKNNEKEDDDEIEDYEVNFGKENEIIIDNQTILANAEYLDNTLYFNADSGENIKFIKSPTIVTSAAVTVSDNSALELATIPTILSTSSDADYVVSDSNSVWVDKDFNTYTNEDLLSSPITSDMILYSEEINPLSVSGTASIQIINKNDNKITTPEEFKLGAINSKGFTIFLKMSTSEKEAFSFTIPNGFSAAIRNVDGFTLLDSETLSNNDIKYTYMSNNITATGNYECLVTSNYEDILEDAETNNRTEFTFKSEVSSTDLSETTETSSFSIIIPEVAKYSINQIDTTSNNFIWTPYDIAGQNTGAGILHWGNQANTLRYGAMTKPIEIEINKTSGTTMQTNWSLEVPLPLYWKALNRTDYNKVQLLIDGNWKTMANFTKAFTVTYPDENTFSTTTGYGLTTKEGKYTNKQILTLNSAVLTSGATDTGLGTTKTVYEWLSEATKIRYVIKSDVTWDPAFNKSSDPTNELTTNVLKDNSEIFNAAAGITLKTNEEDYTSDPLVINLQNGTDTTLKVGIATIDKIQIGLTTSKTTIEQTSRPKEGYAAVFATTTSKNYSYFTNFVASYDFPWDYSPVGTITFSPHGSSEIMGGGSYENNPNCYNYEITITNRLTNQTRIEKFPFVSYNDPPNYTPVLAADEWVSNITVKSDKVWKQSYTTDTSVFNNKTMNHPLFYANYESKDTYITGAHHTDGDIVTVKCNITTDQTGKINGEDKNVLLIGPKDNIQFWTEDMSSNIYPIGDYGNEKNELKYMELHIKKYEDTVIYTNPYFELTGDSIAVLDRVTHASNIGTTASPSYNYLNLKAYRLNTGDWITLSDSYANSLLSDDGSYYDLSSILSSDRYLTGLRLSPTNFNETVVDTLTAKKEIDPSDNVEKYYIENTYYLYLGKKVWPDYTGYNEVLKPTYTNIEDLNTPLLYEASFHCDNTLHGGKVHIKNGYSNDQMISATLIYGDLPEKIFGRDNDYDIASTVVNNIYRPTELTNVAIDDGPASNSTINAWGEMQNATLSFGSNPMTTDEKRMLSLTKGVSLTGADWLNPNWRYNEKCTATIRYKTNKSDEWITIVNNKNSASGSDRTAIYFTLASDEYVTALEVDYPTDFLYKAGYSSPGVESGIRSVQIPDVGLLTKGTLPFVSPVENDTYEFKNGDTFDYHAELNFKTIDGKQVDSLNLDYTSARIVPYPTMYVDDFVSSIVYDSSAVYQGGIITATLTHKYNFTANTASIDTSKIIHPTLCYELNCNFTISDKAVLAHQLGVDSNQITLTQKNDGSGNSILKIEYGPQGPQTRNNFFNITLPLMTRPNAETINVVPIERSWLTLDYDAKLKATTEGEYVSVNPDSEELELNPHSVLNSPDWANDTRLALVTSLDTSININRYKAESMQFYGTDGQGGGLSQIVDGHDGTDDNTFGMTETLYSPSNTSTNWVIYIAIPTRGQKVPYNGNGIAPISEYTLSPATEVSMDNLAGTTYTTKYFVPNGSITIPSMAALTIESTDTVDLLEAKDTAADNTNGVWKTWDEIIAADEREKVSYVRIMADTVPANSEVSSMLLMKLKADSAKTMVDKMSSYTSLIYNYTKADGAMAFPSSETGNMTTNGTGSNYIEYNLVDFNISGQLWHEANFNDTFIEADGDILTSKFMGLILTDYEGNTIYHKDGITPVEVEIDQDTGFYNVDVPSKGKYLITLSANEKNWLPVYYNGTNILNGMQFKPGDDGKGNSIAKTSATALVEITNNDKKYINGGIEEWGTLTISKNRAWTPYVNLNKTFNFLITPYGTADTRYYSAVLVKNPNTDNETQTSMNLEGGTNTSIYLSNKDYIVIDMPVGLGYSVTDKTEDFTTQIASYENGVLINTLEENPYIANTVTSHIVEITYKGEISNGGNEELFTNTYKDVVPSGITDSHNMLILLISLLLANIAMLYYFLSKRKERRFHM